MAELIGALGDVEQGMFAVRIVEHPEQGHFRVLAGAAQAAVEAALAELRFAQAGIAVNRMFLQMGDAFFQRLVPALQSLR